MEHPKESATLLLKNRNSAKFLISIWLELRLKILQTLWPTLNETY